MDQQKMGVFLKKLRNEKNLTQEQLAEAERMFELKQQKKKEKHRGH